MVQGVVREKRLRPVQGRPRHPHDDRQPDAAARDRGGPRAGRQPPAPRRQLRGLVEPQHEHRQRIHRRDAGLRAPRRVWPGQRSGDGRAAPQQPLYGLAPGRADEAGSRPGRRRAVVGPGEGVGRRALVRRQQVRPRRAGAPAGGLHVQAVRLHDGLQQRLLDAEHRPRRAVLVGRLAPAELGRRLRRQRVARVGARGQPQRRRGAHHQALRHVRDRTDGVPDGHPERAGAAAAAQRRRAPAGASGPPSAARSRRPRTTATPAPSRSARPT